MFWQLLIAIRPGFDGFLNVSIDIPTMFLLKTSCVPLSAIFNPSSQTSIVLGDRQH